MTTTPELIDRLNSEMTKIFEGRSDEAFIAQLFSDAANRLRELDKPDCVWTHDGHGNSNTACGEWFSNIMPSGAKFCTNCGAAVREAI